MPLQVVAGMKIYIGGVLADKASDFVESDFAGQSWTLIDGWATAGSLGDAVAEVNTPLINRGRDVKQKGTANAPAMENTFAVVPGDAGQTALIAAGQPSNKNNYAFRIDGSESGVTTPSKRYFVGLVMGTPENGGDPNTAQMMSASIGINSNIVRVAAVP